MPTNDDKRAVMEETEQGAETSAVQVSENKTVESPAPEMEPIPEELSGLPEEYAREAMAKAKAEGKTEAGEPETGESISAETDSETKTDDDVELAFKSIPEGTSVPYKRFKHAYEEVHKWRDEAKALKEQLQQLQNQPAAQQQPAQQPEQPAQPAQQQGGVQVTDELAKNIHLAATQAAMQMAGMTKEEVESLEYMEETDPRKTRYQVAFGMAQANIINGLRQQQLEQQQRAQHFLKIHEASVNSFNAFAAEQQKDPDFMAIKDYATNEFYESLPASKQEIIRLANARVENKTASPAEIQLIQDYFLQAKRSYQGKQINKKVNTEAKAKQAQSLPRYGKVAGAAADTGVNEATLAKMLQENKFSDIPKEYQNILLGM
jgi:hypothetical protein